MLSRLRKGPALAAVVVSSALITGSLVAPAVGAPSALTIAKRALKSAKKASKTANRADARSRRALAVAGQPGPRGAQGVAGKNGTNGFGVLAYPFDGASAVASGTSDSLLAQCPDGTYPTGGDAGANASGAPNADEPSVITQQGIAFDDSGSPFGYYADYDNQTGHPVDVFADAACANAVSVLAKGRHGSRHR